MHNAAIRRIDAFKSQNNSQKSRQTTAIVDETNSKNKNKPETNGRCVGENTMRYMETEHQRARVSRVFSSSSSSSSYVAIVLHRIQCTYSINFYTVDKCFRKYSVCFFYCVASHFLKWFIRTDLTTILILIQKEITPNESLRIISFIIAHSVDGNRCFWNCLWNVWDKQSE